MIRLLAPVALGLALAAPAAAQEPSPAELDPSTYFPTQVGLQWTYELRITAGESTHSIIYTTRVVAQQELPKVGVCAVFQSSSGAKLLAMDWYRTTSQALENPQRQRGKRVVKLSPRVLLDRAALVGLPRLPNIAARGAGGKVEAPKASPAKPPAAKTEAKTAPAKTAPAKTEAKTGARPAKTAKTAEPPPAKKTAPEPTPAKSPAPRAKVRRSWAWKAEAPLAAKGTVTVVGRQRVRLRYYGTLDCVVIEDRGTFIVKDETRTQWRRLWLAPQIGIVREVNEVRAGDRVTFATEAHLMRHE